jgi:molybdopterin/thiamine biosynthesis adenylyltransferase
MSSESTLNFSHQQNLFDPDDVRPVHLIGAGSVGSLVANMLVRIGVTDLTVWDDDFVDSHNVGPSIYGVKDIGRYKVARLQAIIEENTEVRIKTMCRKYAGEPLRGTVVACVDTMEARHAIWSAVRKKIGVDLLVDTRTSERFVQVFTVRPYHTEDIEGYEPFLAYSTEEASRQMCGLHSIIFIASRTAAIAVEALSNFWRSGRTEFVRLEQLGSDMFIHPKQEH